MTATAAPPSDTLVSQPAREVMFAARRSGLRLVHTPTYPIYASNGRKLGEDRGITIEFRDGILRVPLDGQVVTANRTKIPAPELIEWLDEHPLNGDSWEGFTRIEQTAPPVSEEELDAISSATFNPEALQAILDAERAGWGRGAVTRTVEKRLVELAEYTAQIEAQQAAEEAEAKAAAKKAPKA